MIKEFSKTKGNKVIYVCNELQNTNFPFVIVRNVRQLILSRVKRQNLPGSLSLHNMKMKAQIIEELLPSTSNITTGARNYEGLLPYEKPFD